MKRILLLLAVVALFASCSSNKCEIFGRIDNLNAKGTVYLTDVWSAHKIIDTVEFSTSTFHFKRVKHEPTLAQLSAQGGRPIAILFIEEGKVIVDGDALLGVSKATNTPANDAFTAMSKRNEELMSRYRIAMERGDKAEMEAINKEHDAMLSEAFEQNKTNVFGLFMLQQLSYSMPSKLLLEELAKMPESLQNIPFAQRMKATAERRFKTEPQVEGSDYVPHYIDIAQPNLKDEVVSLKSVVENKKNRYVLLDFWASWCGPCMGEMPHLKEAYKLYHAKGFEIYGVSLDTRKESWEEAIAKHGMSWVNVSSLEEFKAPAVNDYAVESIPTNFLIDCSNGVIVAKNLRGEALVEKLAELMK